MTFSDRVATGSFDKTVKIWNVDSGLLYYTLIGHDSEIVSVSFDQTSRILATGSADKTIRLWDLEKGECISVLYGHTEEVIDLKFNEEG